MASWVLLPVAPVTGRCLMAPVRTLRSSSVCVPSSLDTNVSDMSVNAPKGLFPPEPEHYRGPKLKVAIIELGLQACQQHLSFWIKATRWIYMSQGLSLVEKWAPMLINAETTLKWDSMFSLVATVGADENLLVKDHTHTFVNKGGNIGEFDFQFPIGAPIHGILAFLSTNQIKTYDKARNAVALALGPVVKALVDPDGALRDVRNLDSTYDKARNAVALALGPVVKALVDPDGALRDVRNLDSDIEASFGITNLLYTPDADFSCFAGLALTSPEDYYVEGQGSLLQCVLTPGDPYIPLPNEEIIARVTKQVLALFPSSQGLEVTCSSVAKIWQSLYREAPGKDPFRPDRKRPVKNFFLAGSYTKQHGMMIFQRSHFSWLPYRTKKCQKKQNYLDLLRHYNAGSSDGMVPLQQQLLYT
ncbi:zeta-carotene desaturase chloroplastic/chromoplastic [Prunus yedoensis var. nudiflora]|uniref:Zeta-carotene desaturase chloroplastic/chromoplastic n=1 Tax=Prunus yedoensis var. nudiflora TaxID=2094558 RepID=A0A314ZGB4_PRUYE|nr:zeta-carotene desaturase chloroplastic/chromoplastic [Prunus yedoensis var. nudiflora]